MGLGLTLFRSPPPLYQTAPQALVRWPLLPIIYVPHPEASVTGELNPTHYIACANNYFSVEISCQTEAGRLNWLILAQPSTWTNCPSLTTRASNSASRCRGIILHSALTAPSLLLKLRQKRIVAEALNDDHLLSLPIHLSVFFLKKNLFDCIHSFFYLNLFLIKNEIASKIKVLCTGWRQSSSSKKHMAERSMCGVLAAA